MTSISRRGLLGKVAIVSGSMLLATSEEALAATVAVPAALGKAGGKNYLPVVEHSSRTLPFDPAKLDGISEALITSHYRNDYLAVVQRTNRIQESIAKLPPESPPHLLSALKREELMAHNSMILHEHYFENLGGNGKIGGDIEELIKNSFGSVEAWTHNFKLTARSLSGGSGWVILTKSQRDGRLYNICCPDNTVCLAGAKLLLVMDMHEHSYHTDYGADCKSYIEAFFKNIDWQEVQKRIS